MKTQEGNASDRPISDRGLVASMMSVAVAAALVTGVVPGIDLGLGAEDAIPVTQEVLPPAPPTLPPEPGEPILPTDGLTHLLVTPNTQTIRHIIVLDEADPPSQPSGSITSPSNRDETPETQLDDLQTLESAPDGSTLIMTPDGLGIEYPDGSVRLLDGTVIASRTDPADSDPADSDPADSDRTEAQRQALAGLPADTTLADQLAALPGVETVVAVGDGSYSVALDEPDALDGLDLDIEEETFLALFAEPFERYQWFIENDGTTMSRFGLPATLDADIDGTAAVEQATGRGVVVAVIDTGVDFDHPDLAPNRWTNRGETCDNRIDDDANGYVDDCHGFDFVYRDGEAFNLGAHAHGTHVAGTIAAARNGLGVAGVAPEAQIMDLNVAKLDGSMPGSSISEAIRYAVDNGADVINLSLGTQPGAPSPTALSAAIDYAGSKGVLVVAAAGNHGLNIDSATVWPASYDKPNMMTVGASSPDDSRAGFSNYGDAVDIFAPGHQIASTVPVAGNDSPYVFMSGTSMATPIAAGTAALLLSQDPETTPQQLIAALRSTSDIADGLTEFAADGRRINAGEALGGVTEDRPITELAAIVSGLNNAVADEPVEVSIRFEVPADTFDEDFGWEMVLLAQDGDEVFALTDHPLDIAEVPGSTGEDGFVALGVSGTSDLAISMTLPAGDYGLLFDAVPTADPSQRLGDSFIAAFSVRAPAAPPTGPDVDQETNDGNDDPDQAPEPNPESPGTDQAPPGGESNPAPQPPSQQPPSQQPPSQQPPAQQPPTQQPTQPGPDSGTGETEPPRSTTPPATRSPERGTDTPPSNSTEPATGDQPRNPEPTPGQPPTTPTTTRSPAPAQPPAPVERGDYAVTGVVPFAGSIGERTDVTISGRFPDPVRVYFGDVEAPFVVQTSGRITTAAPARTTAGTVDIRLTKGGETMLTVKNGFTYRDPQGTPTPEQPNDREPNSPEPNSPEPNSPEPNSPPPVNQPPSDPAPRDPGTTQPTPRSPEPGQPDQDPAPPPPSDQQPQPDPNSRQSRRSTGAEVVELANGTSGLRLSGPNPLITARTCRSNPCPATRLG